MSNESEVPYVAPPAVRSEWNDEVIDNGPEMPQRRLLTEEEMIALRASRRARRAPELERRRLEMLERADRRFQRRFEREVAAAREELVERRNNSSNSGSNSDSSRETVANGEGLIAAARARAQARVRERAASRVRGQHQERWVPPQNEINLHQPRQRIILEDAPDLGTLYLDLSEKRNSMSLDKFRIGRSYVRVQHGRHAFYYDIDSLQRWLDTGNHTNPDTREPITADGIALFTYGGPVKTSSHGPIQGGTRKKLKRKHAKGTRHKRR